RSAGQLRWLGAALTGLLPTPTTPVQINPGLSLWLDEKRGSRQFQGAREGEYRLFLMKESMRDGEKVDPQELDRITAREVASGRMSPDSEYRALAKAAGTVLGSPKPRKAGWFGKLFK
ncbi:hypothetical protein ACO2Q1_10605, partial [Brevundimonas sp. VNH65]|uniref:hypothetical protein n=1 Tax=Brevundimonas sp. VNH65 TaxID=3400917 RepID=UPI003C08A6FA